MDKYEYKIRSEEIKALIAEGEYAEAAEIADSIDWRRVKSVMMLCTISDLYKINRRFEDSRDLLLLAYDRHPGARSIVYSLCELSIKTGEFVQAVEYYKEFVQVAPKDIGRYVLQYKLYEAQDVSLEERIAVLEELKSRDYTEKWAYELAYLYHRVGLGTRCVEECDELILWFGEGKYVMKAMELKMLHVPLTDQQQKKYDAARGVQYSTDQAAEELQAAAEERDIEKAPTVEIPAREMDIQVKLMGVGQYDTINIQKELAENMKELWEGTEAAEEMPVGEEDATKVFPGVHETETETADELSAETKVMPAITESALEDSEELDAADEPEQTAQEPQETKTEEVFFGETAELDTTADQVLEAMKSETVNETEAEPTAPVMAGNLEEPKHGYEKLLGMEYDGQISLLLPESEQIEKQITGQIKLDDVLLEWERMKKDSEQKRMETVRQRVLQQTGAMFTEFEAQMRDGLLEKLESEKTADEPQDDLEIVEEVEEPEEPTETAEPEEIEEPGEIEEPEEIIELEETAETEEVVEIAKSEETEEPEELEELEEPAEVTETEEEELPEEEIAEPEQTLETEEPTEVADTEEVAESEEIEETETTEQSEQSEQSEQLEAAQPAKLRAFSAEENELFGTYAQSETAKAQIIHAIDTISMASYTGNVIITGDEGMDTLTLAKNLVKEVQNTDSNFSGKIAKISGASLNKKDLGQTLDKLEGGALIVQKAAGMNAETAEKLHKILEQEERGIIILLIDTKKYMNRFMEENAALNNSFTIRMDVEALDNDTLVEFCKKYAREQEYSIDNMAVLALHTRISDRQTSDHAVTISEVRTMMDEAIRHANRKNMGHFFDILLARRYDEEDMIILREKDFV